MSSPPVPREGLSVTALYTAGCWAWAGFEGSALYRTRDTDRVFGVVNAVLRVARWFARDATDLRHDLTHRHAALDHWVAAEDPAVVLELAAGLSPRGAGWTASRTTRWVEVDLAPMVAYKTALLETTAQGRAVLARDHLVRVAADVTTTPLAQIADPEAPAVVIVEGLLVYLTPDQRRDLYRRVAAWLAPAGGVLLFDLLPPRPAAPGWLRRLLDGWMRRFTGGQGFDARAFTEDEVRDDLVDAGFEVVQSVAPADVAEAWGLPFSGAPSSQRVWRARVSPR